MQSPEQLFDGNHPFLGLGSSHRWAAALISERDISRAQRTEADRRILEKVAGEFVNSLTSKQLERLFIVVTEAKSPGTMRKAIEAME